MTDPSDHLLESIVRDWATSQRVHVIVARDIRGGPPIVKIEPINNASMAAQLWVADDGAYAACSIGGGSWWDQAVLLERETVCDLLEAIARGDAGEEVRRIGKYVVGRRGFVQLHSGRRLQYGQLLGIPGLKWEKEHYVPY